MTPERGVDICYRAHGAGSEDPTATGLDVVARDHRADATAVVVSTGEAPALLDDLGVAPDAVDEAVVADPRVDPTTVDRVTGDTTRRTVGTAAHAEDALDAWWAHAGQTEAPLNVVDGSDGETAFDPIAVGGGLELRPLGFDPGPDRSGLAVAVADRASDRPPADLTVFGGPDVRGLRGLYDTDEGFERAWTAWAGRCHDRLVRHDDAPTTARGPTLVEVPRGVEGRPDPAVAVAGRWAGEGGARCRLSAARPGDVFLDGVPPLVADSETTTPHDGDTVGVLRSTPAGVEHRRVTADAATVPPTFLDAGDVDAAAWYPSDSHPGPEADRAPAALARTPVSDRDAVDPTRFGDDLSGRERDPGDGGSRLADRVRSRLDGRDGVDAGDRGGR